MWNKYYKKMRQTFFLLEVRPWDLLSFRKFSLMPSIVWDTNTNAYFQFSAIFPKSLIGGRLRHVQEWKIHFCCSGKNIQIVCAVNHLIDVRLHASKYSWISIWPTKGTTSVEKYFSQVFIFISNAFRFLITHIPPKLWRWNRKR